MLTMTKTQAVNFDQYSATKQSDFLYSIIHELKNPISAILGLADLLKEELKNNSECNEYIEDINLVATEMDELVHDILDVGSAAFSGNFSVDLSKEIDLKNIIKRSIKLNYDYSLKRKIEIRTEISDNIKPIRLDAKRLKQILANLICNSLKYSPENTKIKITSQSVIEHNQEFLEITISDQGFGMTPIQVQDAFIKYKTIENPNSEIVDSFGLGLPIVKQLVELQKGKVQVTSEVNKGTSFVIRFPYGAVANPTSRRWS